MAGGSGGNGSGGSLGSGGSATGSGGSIGSGGVTGSGGSVDGTGGTGTGGSGGSSGGTGGTGSGGAGGMTCTGVASGSRGPFGPLLIDRLIRSSAGSGDLMVLKHRNATEPASLPFSVASLVPRAVPGVRNNADSLFLPDGWRLVVSPGNPDVVWSGTVVNTARCQEGDDQTPWPPPATDERVCGGVVWQDATGARSSGPTGPMTITHLIPARGDGMAQIVLVPPPAVGSPVQIKADDLLLPYDLPGGWKLIGLSGSSFLWNGQSPAGCATN
jgi:hypothetical protein